MTTTRKISDEKVEIDDDEDRLATKRQRSMTTSKDDEPRKREERSEREERETKI